MFKSPTLPLFTAGGTAPSVMVVMLYAGAAAGVAEGRGARASPKSEVCPVLEGRDEAGPDIVAEGGSAMPAHTLICCNVVVPELVEWITQHCTGN